MYLCKKLKKTVARVEDNVAGMVTTFEWRFAGGQMVARFKMLTGRLICGVCYAKVQIRLFLLYGRIQIEL